MIQDNRA